MKSIKPDCGEGANVDEMVVVGSCHGLLVLRRDELPGYTQGGALVVIGAFALAACYGALWLLAR